MTEQNSSSEQQPIELGKITYNEFVAAQNALRAKGRPSIPFIDMNSRPGYRAAMEVVSIVRRYGLEANPNVALGGVTAFVDNAQDFANLQRLIVEHPEFSVQLPR